MSPNRRDLIGLLTVGAVVAHVAEGQTPPAPLNADGDLQAARLGLQRDAQLIAMVKLPHATEPAFRFRP